MSKTKKRILEEEKRVLGKQAVRVEEEKKILGEEKRRIEMQSAQVDEGMKVFREVLARQAHEEGESAGRQKLSITEATATATVEKDPVAIEAENRMLEERRMTLEEDRSGLEARTAFNREHEKWERKNNLEWVVLMKMPAISKAKIEERNAEDLKAKVRADKVRDMLERDNRALKSENEALVEENKVLQQANQCWEVKCIRADEECAKVKIQLKEVEERCVRLKGRYSHSHHVTESRQRVAEKATVKAEASVTIEVPVKTETQLEKVAQLASPPLCKRL